MRSPEKEDKWVRSSSLPSPTRVLSNSGLDRAEMQILRPG